MPTPPSTAGSSTNRLVVIGVVLYLVAWFVPVVSGQAAMGAAGTWLQGLTPTNVSGSAADWNPDWLPGWQACHVSWNMLWQEAPQQADAWKSRVTGSTCLTNAVMLLALLSLLRSSRNVLVGLLLIGCAGLNASWIYLAESNLLETLRAGYYLWAVSFALLGLGMLTARTTRASG